MMKRTGDFAEQLPGILHFFAEARPQHFIISIALYLLDIIIKTKKNRIR
jgi:hypothetical protein